MKIAANGSFGSFVWELPPSLVKSLLERAKLATQIGEELFKGKEVPDMQRFLADGLTGHISAFLLTLEAVNLVGGPGAILLQEQFKRSMEKVTNDCHTTLLAMREIEEGME